MTETSRFWAGTTPGDAGPYTSDQFSDWSQNVLLATKAESGPLEGTGTSPDIGLTVQQTGPASSSIQITPGAALVYGGLYELSGTPPTYVISANVSGNPRIDTVILRKDWTTQTIRLAVLTGTPAGSPVAPTLTQTPATRWEIPLADIAVASGFVTITDANITPRRAWANIAGNIFLLDVLNNSGALLQAGDVVVWDSSADRAVKTSTTIGDPDLAGVWQSRTAAGSYGRVLVQGIAKVNCSAGVSRLNLLQVSSVAKQASVAVLTTTSSKPFALALEAAGPGLVNCFVSAIANYAPAVKMIKRDNGATYTTSSNAFVNVDGTNLSITLVVKGNAILIGFAGSVGATPGETACLDISVDGTRYSSAGLDGVIQVYVAAGYNNASFSVLVTGLSAGSHVFNLMYKSLAGLGITLLSGNDVGGTDCIPAFWATEVG